MKNKIMAYSIYNTYNYSNVFTIELISLLGTYYLCIFLFCAGIWGLIVVKGNLISMLISLEILFLACTLNFIALSYILDDILGQIFVLLILTVTAAESALGLALIITYYRLQLRVSVESLTTLKG